jgi:hypothetical protein
LVCCIVVSCGVVLLLVRRLSRRRANQFRPDCIPAPAPAAELQPPDVIDPAPAVPSTPATELLISPRLVPSSSDLVFDDNDMAQVSREGPDSARLNSRDDDDHLGAACVADSAPYRHFPPRHLGRSRENVVGSAPDAYSRDDDDHLGAACAVDSAPDAYSRDDDHHLGAARAVDSAPDASHDFWVTAETARTHTSV